MEVEGEPRVIGVYVRDSITHDTKDTNESWECELDINNNDEWMNEEKITYCYKKPKSNMKLILIDTNSLLHEI